MTRLLKFKPETGVRPAILRFQKAGSEIIQQYNSDE